ncbi:proteic killer suppression protein [Xanthomonas arboricola]|nr:proteic killer suppression protein [Xanthomonas campestris]
MTRVSIYDTRALTREVQVIKTFADKNTEKIAQGKRVRAWASIERQIQRKLEYLKAAVELGDLRAPPGNRLEQLQGDRQGQYSIRINDQYRICFRWEGGDAYDVEVTDYH